MGQAVVITLVIFDKLSDIIISCQKTNIGSPFIQISN